MSECKLQAELKDAQEIIEAFREDNVRLENELAELKGRMSDVEDLCEILLLIENRSVKILSGIMKQIILGKRNVPAGRAKQGTNQITLTV